MNPVVLYFASGESFYAGACLAVLSVILSGYLKGPWSSRLRNLVAWLGLVLMVMACPPFSWTVDAISAAAFVVWLAATNRWLRWPLWRPLPGAVLCIVLLALVVIELPHRQMPVIVGVPSDHLVVIGDSISSGIDSHVPAWPNFMRQRTNVPVRNLSRAGAQTAEIQDMVSNVSSDDRVVLIEIGGNDLLGDVPSVVFEKNLDAALSGLVTPGRTIVMFELPLLPTKISYGQIQRRLAAKYAVWLIPKRCFADVIRGADATSDGLHLSETGARRMATLVGNTSIAIIEIRNGGRK